MARTPAPFAAQPFAAQPRDPVTAGRRLADYVVLGTSPDVPLVAADYWELSVASYRRVQAAITGLVAGQPDADQALRRLSHAPHDEVAYRDLAAALGRILAEQPGAQASVAALLDEADPAIWIDHVIGGEFSPQVDPCDLGTLRRLPAPRPWRAMAAPAPVTVNVVIPFRDRDPGGRSRNLLACLRSLADQDLPRDQYRVTVVETDDAPRGADLVAGLADRYLFGCNPGVFNKSWAVNLGLRDGAADGAGLTCVLDADILAERTFVRKNVARFGGGHDAHLPYLHMYSLDGPSSDRAIRARLGLGTAAAAEVAPAGLRGLLLRDTPGACLWARTAALGRIGGFDERFEGWGGEDDDVVFRLRENCELVRFDDQLLHLSHPRPVMLRDDGALFNAHLAEAYRTEPWTGAEGFGDPARFRPTEARPS